MPETNTTSTYSCIPSQAGRWVWVPYPSCCPSCGRPYDSAPQFYGPVWTTVPVVGTATTTQAIPPFTRINQEEKA